MRSHKTVATNVKPRLDELRRACEIKAAQLDIQKQAIEVRLMGHCPKTMPKTAHTKTPARTKYSSDNVCVDGVERFSVDGSRRVSVEEGGAVARLSMESLDRSRDRA